MLSNIIAGLLFPFRLIAFLLIHTMTFCLPSHVTNDSYTMYFFSKMNLGILLMLGLYPNKIIDQRKLKPHKVNTRIITFQHRTFADCYMLNYVFGPVSYVFRDRFKNNIFIKNYIKKYGGIAVSVISNQGSTKQIVEYCNLYPNRKLAIAPEDIIDYKKRIISNNKLNVFRTGAFVSLLPIQPVVIKFYDKSVIWRNYQTHSESIIFWTLRRLISPISYFDIYLLTECEPSIMNPSIYKDVVWNKMSEAIIDFE
jgi:hypothetical protein